MKSYTIKFGWKSITLQAVNTREAMRQAGEKLGFSFDSLVPHIGVSVVCNGLALNDWKQAIFEGLKS